MEKNLATRSVAEFDNAYKQLDGVKFNELEMEEQAWVRQLLRQSQAVIDANRIVRVKH